MCRMCLVDVEGPRGSTLTPACFVAVTEDMVVDTTNDRVKKAQDGVLEFLLANHPLDCPVCDKGGECPLQDQTLAYGPGESRFVEEKRHFEKPIAISDLVLLDRERCIQCARAAPASPRRWPVRRRSTSPDAANWSRSRPSRPSPSLRTSAATPCRSVRSVRSRRRRTASPPAPGTSIRSSPPAPPAPSGAGWPCSRRRTGSPGCSASTRSPSTTAGCATRAASPTSRSTATKCPPDRSRARRPTRPWTSLRPPPPRWSVSG